jgi:hypothetical protein
MNKPLILCALAALAAFGQSQTPLTITQSAGSATGELRMQERRTNGTNYVGIKAPQSVAANTVWTLPTADGTANQCLSTDGAGQWGWSTCGAGGNVNPGDYDWSQTITAPGAAGTRTITLTPGPLGVIATDTASQYWLVGTPGSSEAVTSTGTGTCDGTGQTSCTIEVTTANSHTGTTTIASGSVGAQEAINAASSSVTLSYPIGNPSWKTRACTNGKNVTFLGQGTGSAIYLTTPNQQGICKNSNNTLDVIRMSIVGDTTTTGIYAQALVSNGGSDRFIDNFLQNHAVGINHRTATELYVIGNRFYSTRVGFEVANEINSDQGGLTALENNFVCTSDTDSKGVFFHSPGAATFANNYFLGCRDSFYADLAFATVNVSGTAATATTGRFWPIQVGLAVYVDGNLTTIAAYTDATHVTLADNLGTLTGAKVGQSTGQFHFYGNNFDNQNRTGVWFDSKVPFAGAQIHNNSFSNFFNAEAYTAIKLTGPRFAQFDILDNRMANLSGVTYDHTGIYADHAGPDIKISGNTFRAHKYSLHLDLDGSSTGAQISDNEFYGAGEAGTQGVKLANAIGANVTSNKIRNYSTAVSISGASTDRVAINGGEITCATSGTAVDAAAGTNITFVGVDLGTACTTGFNGGSGTTATMAAVVGAPSTRVSTSGTIRDGVQSSTYLKDSGTNNTASVGSIERHSTGTTATGFGVQQAVTLEDDAGTGIIAGGWQVLWEDSTAANRYPRFDVLISKNNSGQTIAASFDKDKNFISYGSLYSLSGTITGRLGAGLSSGVGLGAFSLHPVTIYTDSAARWQWTAAGMYVPMATDTYNIGDLTTPLRVRGVYSKIVDTALAGGTGDYMQTRKLQLADTGGATGFWYLSANATTGTSSINILDNSGSRWIRGYRALSSLPSNDTFVYANWLPAGRTIAGGDAVDDGTLPTIGNLSNRWSYVFGSILDTNTITIRTGATNNYILTSDASGNASWAAPAPCSTCIVNGGNTTGAMLTIGTNDAQTLSLETNNVSYLQINSSGQVTIAGNVVPSGTRDIGATGNEWNELFVGSITATSIIEPKVNGGAQFGDSSKRWSNVYSVDGDYSGTLSTVGLTINTGAATVGHVWTATSTGGAGSWQAASGGSSLPVVDTTGIAKGSSDASKIVRFEVDGLTTGTTRVLTVQDGDHTLAGLNINQTFVNPQTVAIASVQNQLTLSQTNNSGFYDPACLVLASTDTVTSTIYGAARVCSGYESAAFTDEKFAIQTATGSGTYQDAITIKNQAVTILGSIAATGSATFSFNSGTMAGTMKPLFGGTGSIGDSGYSYGAGYFSASGFILTDTTTVGYVWTATSTGGAGSWQAAAACPTCYVQSGNSFGTAAILGTSDNFPVYFKTNNVVRWDISAGGNLVPDSNNAYTFGHPSFRPSTIYAIDLNASGTVTLGGSITGDVLPTTTGAYVSGSNTYRWGKVSTFHVDIDGDIALSSGTSLSGTLVPTTNNFYALGNTSFRWSTVATTNVNISGTITTPSGSAGITSTKTVRDSAGTGTCTLIFSGGILTGGTC